jgi:two-component system phosphate regulon sensor histidine kinase PhoR
MFWRFFGTYSLLLLAAIGLLGGVVLARVERYSLEQIEESLRTKAVLIGEALRDRPAGAGRGLRDRLAELRREVPVRVTLLADDGRVLADSDEDPALMENHADRPEVRQARDASYGTATRFSHTLQEQMMYLAMRAHGGGDVAFVRVALPLTQVQEQLAGIRHLVWAAGVGTALGGLGLTFWLARRITRPLRELTAGTEQIAAGEYGHKVYAADRGEVGALARTFNQMSERLAAQFARLEEDRQQLRTILAGMVEGVIAIDADERILFANERAQELLGLAPQAATGHKVWEVVRHSGLMTAVRQALDRSEPYDAELNWDGSAGKSITVHAARLPDVADSPPRGAVLVLHDRTQLRRLERIRQEFVANASHELKTPLSVIKAAVETLIEGAVNDSEHRDLFLDQIAEQADRLQLLIFDLLSLARVEAGADTFEPRRVPLRPFVVACVERHRGRAEGNDQTLEADASAPEDDVAVWADEEALDQILGNLVDNALKYTPRGGRISVGWEARDGEVCLTVRDSGIGIPERDLPRVFERFFRVDRARSRELGGTGLGLSIVKHLAHAMQGSVSATSRPGHGSTFSVRLPRAPDS